jgi:Family of unknown function (DUF6491)
MVLATPAVAQNSPSLTGTPCLQVPNSAGFKPLPGRRSLVVTDKRGRQYRLNFTAVCEALQARPELGFQTFSNSQYSCVARGDSVYSTTDVGANRLCRIQSIEFYNEEPPPPALPASPTPAGRGRG